MSLKRRSCYAYIRFDSPLPFNGRLDRLFSMFDELGVEGSVPSYPPYNIERAGR